MEIEKMTKKRDELRTLLKRFLRSLGYKFSKKLGYKKYEGVIEESLQVDKDNFSFLIKIIPIEYQKK